MLLCELNNQRGYFGASNSPVQVDSWDKAERHLMSEFPGRSVAGATARERVLALKTLLDKTCAVTFHIIGEGEEDPTHAN